MAPSPDLTPYVDLQLRDLDPQDVFETALVRMRMLLADFDPREGQIEIVLLEAIAQQIAELIFAVNRLPDSIFESLLTFYDIRRDYGEQPLANLRFDVATDQGMTVPGGTVAVLNLESGGLEPIQFTTMEDLVIPTGQTFGVVLAQGDRYTDEANGRAVGTMLELRDAITYVDYVKLSSEPTGGRNTEEDPEYFDRAAQRLQRLVSTLVLPGHFTAAALEMQDVERATTLNNYNPAGDPDNNGPVGDDAGYVTVAVYGPNEFLSAGRKDEIKSALAAQALTNLVINVVDPTITTIDVTADVVLDDNVDPADAIEVIKSELRNYLDPMTWNWNNTIRINSLVSLITNVEGVYFVSNLSVPAANLTLSGVANLTKPGAITINLVEN